MEIFLNLLAAAFAFSIVVVSIPTILKVAREINLFKSRGERGKHHPIVPPLGGVAIFLGFLLSTIIVTGAYRFDSLKYIIASVILLFFIGLKDDLLVISPRKKFLVQLLAAALLVFFGNIQLTNLHGVFGIDEITPFISIPLSLFVILTIINAFNLIDGIDGLASGIGLLASVVFGVWFHLAGSVSFAIMSFALTGSVAGFFIFNVFGKKNKLFMGDTGSLIIGLIISILVIEFNELNSRKTIAYAINAAPSVSFAIVFIPLTDMLRVMLLRIFNGKSPFQPDKNHIHHRLMKVCPRHLSITLIILAANAIIIALAFLLSILALNVTVQFLMLFITGLLLLFFLDFLQKTPSC